MAVKIRMMSTAEFDVFYELSVESSAKELMEECAMPHDAALKETKEEVARMLPDGLTTKYNYLMTIVEVDTDDIAGFIWTLHEETTGRKQNFICDFVILEPKRRKGYAVKALRLVEKRAAEAGCQESVLFVSDKNHAAEALYRKCGYQFLRHVDYGKYMLKQLS